MSPREFTGSGSGVARLLVPHQRAAELADQLPAANHLRRGWYLADGRRLSHWYAAMVRDSAAAGAVDLAAFETAKDRAVRALDHNQLVVVSRGTAAPGTHDTYYATAMSPPDWFTGSAATWSRYEVSAGGSQHGSDPGGTTGSGGTTGTVEVPEFTLQVATDLDAAEIANYVRYATETEPLPPDPPDWSTRLLNTGRLEIARSRVPPAPAVVPQPAIASTRMIILDDRLGVPGWIPGIEEEPVVVIEPPPTEPAVELVEYLMPEAVAAVAEATVPTQMTSRGFAVRFEYCLVRLDRPWWDDVFLSRRDWQVPGYQPGKISSGSATGGGDAVPVITIGMLVIRDLTITADWTAADRAALPLSTSLGPFCVAAGDFDVASGTLRRAGLQAIAWLVRVLPVLPPRSSTPSSHT
jgi:2-oxoglutarate dehydrogenase E2 component (dihydrolipoamide succinyltransferase)